MGNGGAGEESCKVCFSTPSFPHRGVLKHTLLKTEDPLTLTLSVRVQGRGDPMRRRG